METVLFIAAWLIHYPLLPMMHDPILIEQLFLRVSYATRNV